MLKPTINCQQLAEQLNENDLIVLSVRQKINQTDLIPNLDAIQIIGARHFELETLRDMKSPFSQTLPSATQFQKVCQKLGINQSSRIVIYDNQGIHLSPQVWWMFKTMGHAQVAVLDGGLPAWFAGGYDCEPFQMSTYEPGDFEPSLNHQPA